MRASASATSLRSGLTAGRRRDPHRLRAAHSRRDRGRPDRARRQRAARPAQRSRPPVTAPRSLASRAPAGRLAFNTAAARQSSRGRERPCGHRESFLRGRGWRRKILTTFLPGNGLHPPVAGVYSGTRALRVLMLGLHVSVSEARGHPRVRGARIGPALVSAHGPGRWGSSRGREREAAGREGLPADEGGFSWRQAPMTRPLLRAVMLAGGRRLIC